MANHEEPDIAKVQIVHRYLISLRLPFGPRRKKKSNVLRVQEIHLEKAQKRATIKKLDILSSF